MKHCIYMISLSIILFSCQTEKRESTSDLALTITKSFSDDLLSEMQWLNQPESFEIVDSSLVVTAAKGTDFFNNPEDNSRVGSAPYLYKSMSGDFVAKTMVGPDFTSQWNAVALMVYIDSLNWIKFAFENSDATGPGIVTVVTKGTSDDANGVVLNRYEQVWLAMARKDNIYSMHWSIDNKDYKMARLTSMPEVSEVRVGVEFQSPVGDVAKHSVHFFEIEQMTVENLRALD